MSIDKDRYPDEEQMSNFLSSDFEDTFNKTYSAAIDHAIKIVRSHRDLFEKEKLVLSPPIILVLNKVIASLKQLKQPV